MNGECLFLQLERKRARRSPSSDPRSLLNSSGASAGTAATGRGPDMLGARLVAALPLLETLLKKLPFFGDKESSSTAVLFSAAMAGDGSGDVDGESDSHFSVVSYFGEVEGAS